MPIDFVAVIPLFADNQLQGVLEIGFPSKIKQESIDLLEDVSSRLAQSIYQNRLSENTVNLYDQLQHQNEELQAQHEELMQNTEELHSLNENLESQVRDLNDQKNELKSTFNDLQHTQVQLVQAEKMSSLGQLTAGIAHEINNPINFVFAGANTLKVLIKDIHDVLDKYHEIDLEGDPAQIAKELKEIEDYREEIYFQDITQDTDDLLKDILQGAERTQAIVKSLRTFSRLDEKDIKKADLHENINSTLVILNTKISNKIEVIKDYSEFFPGVDCNIGQLNQVFMNLLSNAVDAIKDKGTIHIKTWQEEDTAHVSISDSGSGMSPDVIQRIFEPFFSTKDVGKGTGLGLSISHGIIEKHSGTIEVQSEVGKGTIFTVKLPIDHQVIAEPEAEITV
ncbi:MAG: signal transduction histidine kinase [Flammeovirgaceae bacterium]|jgi:signal transduction histidine kinase